MKSLRYVKLRTFATSPEDIAMEQNHNPLRERCDLKGLDGKFNAKYLAEFKDDDGLRLAVDEP